MQVTISDARLRQAAAGGPAAFLQVVTDAIKATAGGELNADTMSQLSAPQTTLWAYDVLREEVMQGGFVQLIHNGWGPFFFRNPFAKLLRQWGLNELGKLIYSARELYFRDGERIEADFTDDEFMALYEQFPDFEHLDDDFIDGEENYTAALAQYVDEHLTDFVEIV